MHSTHVFVYLGVTKCHASPSNMQHLQNKSVLSWQLFTRWRWTMHYIYDVRAPRSFVSKQISNNTIYNLSSLKVNVKMLAHRSYAMCVIALQIWNNFLPSPTPAIHEWTKCIGKLDKKLSETHVTLTHRDYPAIKQQTTTDVLKHCTPLKWPASSSVSVSATASFFYSRLYLLL